MADVQLIKVEVSVPKELADVRDLILAVAQDFKDGKKPIEVVYDVFPKLQGAISGLNDIPAELKSKEVYTLGAVLVADLLGIFLVPKVAAAVADAMTPAPAAVEAPVQTPDVAPAIGGAPLG